MIVDLPRFVESGRPYWAALERTLDRVEKMRGQALSIEEVERFDGLYRRASADLARVAPLASEGELRSYLEWLVGRAYAEIHEARESTRFRPWRWFTQEFPRAFRRHVHAFQLAVALTIAGSAF